MRHEFEAKYYESIDIGLKYLKIITALLPQNEEFEARTSHLQVITLFFKAILLTFLNTSFTHFKPSFITLPISFTHLNHKEFRGGT